jgi:hypothetical protein
VRKQVERLEDQLGRDPGALDLLARIAAGELPRVTPAAPATTPSAAAPAGAPAPLPPVGAPTADREHGDRDDR